MFLNGYKNYVKNLFHLVLQSQEFIANLKSHIFIFWNQKLWVENTNLLNLHKRLSIQSLVIANFRPMFTICQHYCFIVWGVFYKNRGRLWRLSLQGRKRKEVNKLPWKYYINNFILMNNSVSYPWVNHKWNTTYYLM